MIINWVAAKAQQLLPAQNAGLDELSFDFALSAEVMDLLYAKNDGCMAPGAVAEAGQQDEAANMNGIIRVALDEHELALA